MILSSSSLSSITEKPSIIEDIDLILGTDTTSFPYAEKLRLINKWYLKVGLWFWEYQNTWKFRDANATTLRDATSTLVVDQLDYAIPTTALSIEYVKIMDTNGDYVLLEKVAEFDNIPENDDAAFPTQWKLQDNSIIINKKPSSSYVTYANGIKIGVSQQITKFTKSDASVSPGFPEQFHELLSKGASFDFALANNIFDKANMLKKEINEMRLDLMEYCRKRDEAQKPIISPRRTSYI